MPRLYVDVTTAFQELGRHPHGSTRVERGIVAALAAMARPDIVFFRFSRPADRFIAVAREGALRIATAPTLPERRRQTRAAWRKHPLAAFGRLIESGFRRRVRDPLWRHMSRLTRRRRAPETFFEPDSTVLLLSELRHDFGLLIAAKRRRGVRLAVMFYDLLGVLPPGDPRLADPDFSDLPSSDFIAREAALVFAISRHSAALLVEHIRSRKLPMPPVRATGLAGQMTPGEAGLAPVEGLAPGRFVLTVGNLEPRKNHRLLFAVWKDLAARMGEAALPLAVAGPIGRDGTAIAAIAGSDEALHGLVRFLPNLGDDALRWLYANCRFTVFPSLIEGFGLPVAESLTFGKVCVASNTSSMPEASQGCTIHLDPHDAEAWRAAIERLMRDDGELRREEDKVRARYRPVTWDAIARDIVAAIDGLEGEPRAPREVAVAVRETAQ